MDTQILVGERVVVRGALALFPLTTQHRPAPGYDTGPAAAAAGTLKVQELEHGASVPDLVVENLADVPVLLIEGETLLGAKQNRTLNVSVLCAPRQRTPIPVSCVEAGRWGAPQASRRSPRLSPQRMRSAKLASTLDAVAAGRGLRSDQARVWSDVDEYALRFAAPSPTSSLEDVFDAAAPMTAPLVEDLEPAEGQQGVLVAIGGEIRGLDLFDKPSTLASYWSGLLAGYALEAVGRSDGPVPLAAARDFAGRVSAGTLMQFDAPGLGEASRLRATGAFGAVRSWDGALVHLAAFADDVDPTSTARPIVRHRGRMPRA